MRRAEFHSRRRKHRLRNVSLSRRLRCLQGDSQRGKHSEKQIHFQTQIWDKAYPATGMIQSKCHFMRCFCSGPRKAEWNVRYESDRGLRVQARRVRNAVRLLPARRTLFRTHEREGLQLEIFREKSQLFYLNLKHNIFLQSSFLLKQFISGRFPDLPASSPKTTSSWWQSRLTCLCLQRQHSKGLIYSPFHSSVLLLYSCLFVPLYLWKLSSIFYSLYSNKNLRYGFVI